MVFFSTLRGNMEVKNTYDWPGNGFNLKIRPKKEFTEGSWVQKKFISSSSSKKWPICPQNGPNWSLHIYFRFPSPKIVIVYKQKLKKWTRSDWKPWNIGYLPQNGQKLGYFSTLRGSMEVKNMSDWPENCFKLKIRPKKKFTEGTWVTKN